MMKRVLPVVFFLLSLFSVAQDFRYLGVDDGLSNRRVYSILKGKHGYMWFLTHEGVDRFNGSKFKNYKLEYDGKEINSLIILDRLERDTEGSIWVVNKQGKLFMFNHLLDRFQFINHMAQENPNDSIFLRYAHLDRHDRMWLSSVGDKLFIYDIASNTFSQIGGCRIEGINNVASVGDGRYYISNQRNIYRVYLEGHALRRELESSSPLETFTTDIKVLYYHRTANKLIIGSYTEGVFVYDDETKELQKISARLDGVSVVSIKELNETEVAIATDGAGVYRMNVYSGEMTPYLVTQFDQRNQMSGNNVNDIYIDEEKRLWMATYPTGITVYDERYPNYKWIRHSMGNTNSLINNQVNCILEDHEGDLWYATDNGVCCFNVKTQKWVSVLSSFHTNVATNNKNHIFLSLCEVEPGVILVGGHLVGFYCIRKNGMNIRYFVPEGVDKLDSKYIRTLYKDSKGMIWAGGQYSLLCLNGRDLSFLTSYPEFRDVNVVLEKDPAYLWVGCSDGLYMLNVNTGESSKIRLPIEASYVNCLYNGQDGLLYIGTNGAGLITYNPHTKRPVIYHKDNSALITNNIHTILPNEGELLLSTENGLSQFNIKNKTFRNWTKGQGMKINHFNPNAGIETKQGTIILGSGEGVIEFDSNAKLPMDFKTKLILSDFQLFYQKATPGSKNCPLGKDINELTKLNLNYNQNIFSLNLSSINYDNPANIIYSWKLDGFYDEWSTPHRGESVVRYTNLSPGKYVLRIRAISEEDMLVLEERSLDIVISPPFWGTVWAMILYGFLLLLVGWVIIRYYFIRKEGKTSADKIDFFINTAHDIRTPLSLIKAPLDEIMDKETLTQEGEANLLLAIRNTNSLYRLISNLINFERTNMYSMKLNVEEYELYAFLEETVKQFRAYAESKRVDLQLESDFRFLNVWFDRSKMDSILKNLISNAIKYTPAEGSVRVIATSNADSWSIEVKDTGIGIPPKEQKKLFTTLFRGSNATNLKVPGTGIGLLLVRKLVRIMKGTISVKSSMNVGSSFIVSFKQGNKHFKKSQFMDKNIQTSDEVVSEEGLYEHIQETETPDILNANPNAKRLLVVDDNDELREYLKRSLAEKYNVTTAANGKEALDKVKTLNPHLIVSDIMMPEMTGDVLCAKLKSDIETSHIPVILLSALSNRTDILDGLATRADEYLTKPFDIAILKAIITSLLENRAILMKKYVQLDLNDYSAIDEEHSLDYQFMTKVKEVIDENMDNSDFNVDTLSGALFMSRSSFYNKIKMMTDQAPADFIRLQRMNRAAHLLRMKEYTITEIADKVGFSDAKYFREVFKKHFNMTPSQYISEHDEQ